MTKSQIIEILENTFGFDGAYYMKGAIGKAADAILALPIEMPTEEEIDEWADSKERRLTSYHKGLQDGAKAMRDGEIIRRNK